MGNLVTVLSIAALATLTSVILDCDETFNYWEPLHYLLYGHGLRPWEYSEQFALRPYAFLYLLYIPAKLLSLIGLSKWAVFKTIKFLLSFANIYSLNTLCREFNVDEMALITPGILSASVAFLPNSAACTMAAWSLVFWRRNQTNKLLLTLAAMTILTWPYAIVFYLPFVFSRFDGKQARFAFQFRRYILAALFSIIYIVAPVTLIDYLQYGKVTLTWFNAVLYNVLGGNDGRFGTESAHFYLFNGLLNYNILLLLPLASLTSLFSTTFYSSFILLSSRAHKEERFLYPLIPLLVVASGKWTRSKVVKSILLVSCAWRLLSVKQFYGGVDNLYSSFPFQAEDVVCMKDQWYRFPSHFVFKHPQTRVGFMESMSFDGALPQYYSNSIFATYNDQNKRTSGQFTNKCTIYYGTKADFPTLKPLKCTKVLSSGRTKAPCRWLTLPKCKVEYDSHCIFTNEN